MHIAGQLCRVVLRQEGGKSSSLPNMTPTCMYSVEPQFHDKSWGTADRINLQRRSATLSFYSTPLSSYTDCCFFFFSFFFFPSFFLSFSGFVFGHPAAGGSILL